MNRDILQRLQALERRHVSFDDLDPLSRSLLEFESYISGLDEIGLQREAREMGITPENVARMGRKRKRI